MPRVLTRRSAHQAGATVTGTPTQANSIGPCCKLFFPCDEGSGNRITDLVHGIALDLNEHMTVSWGVVENAVRGTFGTLTEGTLYNKAPTLGDITDIDIGTKDFIIFCNANLPDGAKFTAGFRLGETSIPVAGPAISFWDTESISCFYGGISDSIAAQTVDGHDDVAMGYAMIRDAGGLKLWHDYDDMANVGSHGGPFGQCSWHQEVYDTFTEDGNVIPVDDMSVDNVEVWECQDNSPVTWRDAHAVTNLKDLTFTDNLIDLGNSAVAAGLPDLITSWYGIAIFAFNDGLPADYPEALRWMRRQWEAGNKILWPGWATLK